MDERVPDEDVPLEFLPKPGPVNVPCSRCRQVGGLAVDNRLEYLDPPEGGWPPGVDAARLALACRGCGSDFLSVSVRLVADTGASLAGVQPKVSAREVPWLTCEDCKREAGARSWPWMACSLCGAEERGSFHRR